MSKLMSSTQKKHVSIRRRLRKRNPAFRMRFFEELLRNEEPTMSSIEDKFEAETRFSCMAREHCNAYEKFIKKNWEINDKVGSAVHDFQLMHRILSIQSSRSMWRRGCRRISRKPIWPSPMLSSRASC